MRFMPQNDDLLNNKFHKHKNIIVVFMIVYPISIVPILNAGESSEHTMAPYFRK